MQLACICLRSAGFKLILAEEDKNNTLQIPSHSEFKKKMQIQSAKDKYQCFKLEAKIELKGLQDLGKFLVTCA